MLKPLYSNVLVKQDDAEKMTEGGIHIPDTSEDAPLTGTVLAAGEGYVLMDDAGSVHVRRLIVKEGDRIMFGKYSGAKIELDGDEFIVMDEADIYGIL